MNLNEMPGPLVPLAVDIAKNGGIPYHRYASSLGVELRRQIAGYHDLTEEHVLLEAGADGGLRLLFQRLSHEQQRLWIPEPSYVGFRQIATMVGCRIVPYQLLDDVLQVQMSMPLASNADAVLVCNPNNPFGHVEENASRLLDHRQGLIIFDEAYAEFAGPSEAVKRICEGQDNVAVVRTFSKAFGAAGIRLGYLLGSPTLLRSLDIYRLEYAVSCFAIEAGLKLWSLRDRLLEVTATARHRRKILEQSLASLGFRSIGSSLNVTNFFSCYPPLPLEACRVAAELRETGNPVHVVQTLGQPTLLRITAGHEEENQSLHDRLRQLVIEAREGVVP